MDATLDKLVSLCKRRGFVFPGSEIYGGLANTWDYGPLGVELKNNLRQNWWHRFVHQNNNIYGLDGGIILNPKIWEASGHTKDFIDVLVECKKCHKRFRLDFLKDTSKCPECSGQLTEPRKFVPMFKTFIGATESTATKAYLRPETAQAIFVNFKNIIDSFHPKIPFGIAQVGKSFRNEITLGNFIFRSLEFEQMELEYFIESKMWESEFEQWQAMMTDWITGLGVKKTNLRWRRHDQNELSHYSKRTEDLEYRFPFGFKELYGLAYRTDYDLRQHSIASGEELLYQDSKGDKFYPHVIEPSFGLERTFLVILFESYREEKGKEGTRVILSLPPILAPFKIAIFPLLPNKDELVSSARKIFTDLKRNFSVTWDDIGNIGKRYRRQDEIGTPWCVTVDFDTLQDKSVTVRDRDTMKQTRIAVSKLENYFKNQLADEK